MFDFTPDNIDNISSDISHPILLLHRISCRLFRASLPLRIGDHRLFAAFSAKNLNVFHFRWLGNQLFWKVTSHGSSQTCEKTVLGDECHDVVIAQWQLLVYQNERDLHEMNEELTDSLGGQKNMICRDHNQFLLKQSDTLSRRLLCQILRKISKMVVYGTK